MQAQELLEDVERNGKHWGATQGSQDGRTLQGAPWKASEHRARRERENPPWKASEHRARREREDPAGSTLESLREQGQTRAGGPCREHPGKPQSTGPDASVLLPPRKRTRAPGIQDDAGPRLQGKAWPAPGKALSSLKSPASQAQAHCPDKPLPQNWTCEFRVPAWWVRASAWFTANAASWWEGWGALSL